MSKRRFTADQINELSKNKNVSRCSKKSISYGKDFKQLAVTQYQAGMSSKEIFQEAGFNLALIGEDVPVARLGCWRQVYEVKGPNGLAIETRGRHCGGGRPKTKGVGEEDRVKRLEIEIAYLKAENDFLVKLRAAKKR